LARPGHTEQRRWLLFVLLAILASTLALAAARPAPAAFCDCTTIFAQLRSDITIYVPAPWQTSFLAHVDAMENLVEHGVPNVARGDVDSAGFFVTIQATKDMNTELNAMSEKIKDDGLRILRGDLTELVALLCPEGCSRHKGACIPRLRGCADVRYRALPLRLVIPSRDVTSL